MICASRHLLIVGRKYSLLCLSVSLCTPLYPENGGSTSLLHVGKYKLEHTMSHPNRLSLSYRRHEETGAGVGKDRQCTYTVTLR
jgi:hypothetical protein